MAIRTRWVCIPLGFLFALTARATTAAEPLRFCVTGDNKGHDGYADVLRQIANLPGGGGQFMVHAGDTHPTAKTREQLDAALGKAFPLYAAVGNHELGDKGTDPTHNDMLVLSTLYGRELEGKINPGPERTKETTYSFGAGHAHVVVLNLYWNVRSLPHRHNRRQDPALRCAQEPQGAGPIHHCRHTDP
ncbi:MAG TPA: metallophosphoesterase [Planctomycetota bacterium]|nr:metallophosphoesterase [Planctomycetota bacterium]